MAKLTIYSELLGKLKDGDTSMKLNGQTFNDFQKDLQNVNDSNWKEVQEFVLLCIDCRKSSTMEYATAVLKKKNLIKWKDHVDVLPSFLQRIFEYYQQPATSEENASTYQDFMKTLLPLLKSLKQIEKQHELMWKTVKTALQSDNSRLHNVTATFSEYLPWLQKTEWGVEVMETSHGILQKHPELDAGESLAECVTDLWTKILNSVINSAKKAAAYVDSVKKVFLLCKDAEWFDAEEGKKPTLNYKILMLILLGFIQMHKDKKELLVPFIPICKELWDSSDEDITDSITNIMTSIDGNIAAELGGEEVVMRLIDMFLTDEDVHVISNFGPAYTKCPKPFNERLEEIASHMLDQNENLITFVLTFFQGVATENAEVFTPLVVEKIVETLSMESTFHMGFLPLVAVCDKRPELFEPHEEAIIASMYQPDHIMMYAQGGNILAKMAVANGSQERAKKYMKVFADLIETGPPYVALCLIINMRAVGSEYRDAMAEYKDLFEERKTEQMYGEHCVIALNELAGRTLDGVAKDIETANEDLADLDERVTGADNQVADVMANIDINQIMAQALKEETEEQGERLSDLEDTVEGVVERVEDIDKKTISHAPMWSDDVSQLLNKASDNDWQSLAKRLDYSDDDITTWSTKTNPSLWLFESWFSKNKKREATLKVLTILEEINRSDAYLIVENALKQADGVISEKEFEYTTPPPVFLSYQWSIQEEVKLLKQHLEMAGYQVWMDVGQMGGGNGLFEKIDSGIRNAMVVLCCITEKYAKSPNCNREVNLAVNLKKPLIPLLMEKMPWPPTGSMGPIFGESLFIRFFSRKGEQDNEDLFWPSAKFQELLMQIRYNTAPDRELIQEPYKNWMTHLITSSTPAKKAKKPAEVSQPQKEIDDADVFISYQWDKQPQIKSLYSKLTDKGNSCWLDILQMGGGDALYDKIDTGLRNCKVVVPCVTPKYLASVNCRREASLAKSLNKPILALRVEGSEWPPTGPLASVFKGVPYIDFSKLDKEQVNPWKGKEGEELISKLNGLLGKGNSETQAEETGVKEKEADPRSQEHPSQQGNSGKEQTKSMVQPQNQSEPAPSGNIPQGSDKTTAEPSNKPPQGADKTKAEPSNKPPQGADKIKAEPSDNVPKGSDKPKGGGEEKSAQKSSSCTLL